MDGGKEGGAGREGTRAKPGNQLVSYKHPRFRNSCLQLLLATIPMVQ